MNGRVFAGSFYRLVQRGPNDGLLAPLPPAEPGKAEGDPGYFDLFNRSARRHGGYVGPGAVILGEPLLPHGLHGVYISRFAAIGAGCRIYQNVTIGEVNRRAPVVGNGCLIGAGAVLVGDIRIGDGVKIGAGAVVCQDIPAGSTVVAQPPRILEGGTDCA